jgi:3-deoxy-D-manno-octulosonic acid (KDO) 8-phosphate synthase
MTVVESDTVIFDGTQSDQALGAHTAAGGGRSSSAISHSMASFAGTPASNIGVWF